MTEHTLELALLLPREAECSGCVDEVSRELGRVAGVHVIDADVHRGLITVKYDEDELGAGQLETYARRAGAQAHCREHCPLAIHDHGQLDLLVPLLAEDGGQRRILHVTGMDCADCAAKLQSALRRERGVRAADVNFGAATLAVVIDPSQTEFAAVYTAVRRLGYDTLERHAAEAAARPGSQSGAAVMPEPGRRFWPRERRAQLIVASGALVVAGFAAQAAALDAAPWFFALAMIAGGAYVARAAFFSLRARQVDMNVLMTLAALGAVAIGEWGEAALVVFLFGFGTALQAATLERTRRAIRSLMELTPPTVTVLLDGAEVERPVAEVVVGDVVLVRPGERLAVDGVVLEGHASANQAPITGESAPVAKKPGDDVFAGSIVEGGSLRVRATTAAAENTIAKIVHLVEEAQAKRAPSQAIVDRFAARYTPVVVALAAAVAFVPPLFLGQPFDAWFYRGLAVLIISCPCALVISTPVSILAALGRATRSGVLIKGGVYLEQAAKIRAIAFDKTGTLTSGRPQVTDIVGLRGTSEERVLLLAAAVERLSEHPLARAILEASAAAPAVPRAVERFRAIAGKGVRAEVDGRLLFVGRPDLLGAHGEEPGLVATVDRLERTGKTVVVLGDEQGGLGVIAVSDPLRLGAAVAIRRLRALGVEHMAMLTGDNPVTAAAIAGEAGISDVRAGLLPAGKVAAAAELRDRYGTLAMVGDGVNDAPALATASLGIAMGVAGTDAALDFADIVLMGDDLAAVPETIRLARRTTRIIWQNIVFSIAVKGLFLVLAPLGLVTLWMAVFADMGTSLLVTANGLRLSRRERPDRGGT